ncbi:helix-turn-helix domain-containing protein [Amycolatopsis roodepoortensis]|uniref:IclR family transcriptional regulator n=1 Tax=Amycolatopsis lurida NRRL 2430 TaxID=1460371 RepID=A0A2P2FWG4_AMYLU|nr:MULTISPECIES: helix-turn-helix domain-containing protein [Amycolatopsis]RSN21086.1 IclR family transcriptional regulator [Streptomyces sp. WAC 05977]KFU81081.1 IclR family transcriptional regulator [Amycolatopsis lurida NRRL 2430]RSN59423.1 IclR family transcriptional regulator [Amycolatopsis sp. WAC 04182]UUV28339.1 helix-turn-helix domain-containing protein [Amycolatopsis roodepoortensis]SED57870.1 DNA-binding transcriptional regulator, IclR family [Amycolatopsis lurida]
MTREGSLTLDRGLALLQAVADAGGEAATISELAVAIGASRAAVYRLLVPLSERGLVWRDGNKVRLGVGLLRLAGQVLPQLREAARPVLRELAEKVGATAHLSVAQGDQAQAVAVVEPSWTSFHVAYRVGTRHPLSAGAAGKAITLRPGGGEGWVTSSGELEAGASGVAAPVRGVPGLKASVGVVSLEPLDASVVGPAVVAAAVRLAEVLKQPE